MTISSSVTKNQYSGNGSTVAFAYTFKILNEADIEVIIKAADGTETVKTLTTDYSVSGVGSDAGGTVTMVVAPTATEDLVLRRNPPFTQGKDYTSGDPFPAETHEEALDERTIEAIYLKELADRSLKIPIGSADGFNAELPAPVTLKVPRVNAAVTGFEWVDSGDLAIISTNLSWTPPWVNAVGRTAYDEFGLRVHINHFGGVGDGAMTGAAEEGAGTGTDNATALQRLFDHLKLNGGTGLFDSKVYRSDSIATLLRDSNTGARVYILEGNGATLDFSNVASGDYVSVGADSLANIATDGGAISIRNLKIYGQQAGNPGDVGTAATNTATTGLKIEWAYNVSLVNVQVNRCYIGIETHYCFPVTAISVQAQRNIVGVLVDSVSNEFFFANVETPNCRFGLIADSTSLVSPDDDGGKSVNNIFYRFRAEGCQVPVHLDTTADGSGSAKYRDWHFIAPYFSGSEYEEMRFGTVVDIANPQTIGADAPGRIYHPRMIGGNWGVTTYQLPFDSGSVQPSVGDVLSGATSGETGTVKTVTLSSGTWGGGDAAGTLSLINVSAAFTDGEQIDNDTTVTTNVAEVNGTSRIKHAIAFAGNNNTRQIRGEIPVNPYQNSNYILNRPRNGKVLWLGQADVDSDAVIETTYYNDGTERVSINDSVQTLSGVATPSVKDSTTGELYRHFNTVSGPQTHSDFLNGQPGLTITIVSKGAITYDTTGTNLKGSTVDIVTATGDITQWYCEDGTIWRLVQYTDISVDNSAGA